MTATHTATQSFFEGFTYSFIGADGRHWESVVENGEPVLHEMVETHDDSLARLDDCTEVKRGWYSVHRDWYSSEQLEEAEDNGEVGFVPSRDEYWHTDHLVRSEEEGGYLHNDDAVELGGEYYHTESDSVRYDHNGEAFHRDDDDYNFVESRGEWYHCSESHWSEDDEEYHVGDESDCDYCCGGSDRICRYHNSPKATLFRGVSPFLVGFEVEKTSIEGCDSEGERITETPLFSGWETDSSCGVEGITHAYDPLDADMVSRFRQDLLDSRDLVNEPCDKSCGGHINLSSTAHTPRELLALFRGYAPLWYAVYRSRLSNGYCGDHDKKIEHGREKYSPARTKDFGIEIRLPNRVRNAEVLGRRFDWMSITCQAMLDGKSFNAYVKDCRDLLLNGAYAGDRVKYAMILRFARRFRVWFMDGAAHPSIQQWI